MKKSILVLLVSISLADFVHAQNQQWMVYNADGNNINALIEEGNNIWAGTQGGLVKFNKTTGDKTYYNMDNSGLPVNSISSLALDNNGTKWMATSNGSGLTKFDGTNWTVYNTANSDIPNDYVGFIVAANNGILWMSCDGLTRFDGTTWTTYNSSNSGFPPSDITSITYDENDFLWIGTLWAGLVKYDGVDWTIYNTLNSGIPSDGVRDVEIDSNGNILVSTDVPLSSGVLSEFDGTNWVSYSPVSGSIFSLTFDTNGTLWGYIMNTLYGYSRLARFDGAGWIVYTSSNSGLPYDSVQDIVIDSSGTKWLGIWYFGLVKFDDTNWTTYNISNSGLPTNNISSVVIDGEGTKWLGVGSLHFYSGASVPGGLVMFDGTSWTNYNISNSDLPYESVNSLAIEDNGTIWLGNYDSNNGDGALVKFDGTTWAVYDTSNSGLPFNYVSSIAIDDNGIKWIGTGGGLSKFDDFNWTTYNTSNSDIPLNMVNAITIDESESKWIGTREIQGGTGLYGGITKFDGTTWVTYDTSNSDLHDNKVNHIAIDVNGTKWIGTPSGLSKFDGTNWMVYNTSNSELPCNYVSAIAIDDNGTKWIGTFDYYEDCGLAAFDGTNWTVYNTSNSALPDDRITSIKIDQNNTKWIGTSTGGLAAFNENGIPVWVSDNVKAEHLLHIYPNPAHNLVNIELLSNANILMIEIINMQGRTIRIQKIANDKGLIDVRDLPGGFYILRIYTDNGCVVEKLVKH